MKYLIDMIFDFHLMVYRTDDPMDLSQMISALILVFLLIFSRILSASERAEILINLKTDPKEREHESAQFLVSLIQMWLKKGSWIVRICIEDRKHYLICTFCDFQSSLLK